MTEVEVKAPKTEYISYAGCCSIESLTWNITCFSSADSSQNSDDESSDIESEVDSI